MALFFKKHPKQLSPETQSITQLQDQVRLAMENLMLKYYQKCSNKLSYETFKGKYY